MTDLTVIQLTDTHIRAEGEQLHNAVDTHANLTRVLDRLHAAGGRIDALVLSGDLTDTGDPAAYRRLREAIEPAAAELGAQVIYAMGNHDERGAFGTELLGLGPAYPARPHYLVRNVAGLRIIALDSTIPGRHDGHLDTEQLHWLATELSTPAPRGTLIVVHHPPLRSSLAAARILKLHNPDELGDVIAGTDVRLIVSGHHHLTAAGALAGTPVWIGPAVAYRLDAMAAAGRQQATDGFGFSRIDIIDDAFVVSAVEVTPATQLYDRDEAAELERMTALTPEHR